MYKKHTLSNGIRVVTECIPFANSISIGYWMKSGSRYENSKNNGISHMIEHMLFKGTKNRSAKKLAEEIESLGGQINAFTGKETTCFYVKLLDEHYETGINVLSDMLLNSNFNENDIEKEKGVIVEEINMYEDSPEDLVADLLAESVWKGDSLSFPILGTEKTVRSFNKQIILDYFEKMYVPQNLVISVAGNFDEEKLLNTIEKNLSSWKADNKESIIITSPEVQKNIALKTKDIEQLHVSLTLHGIKLGEDSLYSLYAINNYFGGGSSSILFQKLREEKAFVYTIYSYPSAYKNAGAYNIYFALNEKYIDKAVSIINCEIQKLVDYGLNEEQIKKAREQLKGNYILGLESISSRMFSMGKSEIMLEKIEEPKDVLNRINSITKENINNVINTVFKSGVLSAAVVGKNASKQKIENLIWR